MPPKARKEHKLAVPPATQAVPTTPKIFADPSLLSPMRLKEDLAAYGVAVSKSSSKPELVRLYTKMLTPFFGREEEANAALTKIEVAPEPSKRKPATEVAPSSRTAGGGGKRMRTAAAAEHAPAAGRGPAKLANPHLALMPSDHLYHIGLSTADDLKGSFGDVRVVCFGGSKLRMESFAAAVAREIGLKLAAGQQLSDISTTDRYHVFKAGPVLSISHGIGNPSAAIILHETTKMLQYAGVDLSTVVFLRIGTSGGLGVSPGTVVLTTKAVNGMLRPEYTLSILGEEVKRPTDTDESLNAELRACCPQGIAVVSGCTMSCDDFYEGQGRLDGAACHYTTEAKMAFLAKAYKAGVRNVEMESLVFTSFCQLLGIRAAVVCVTLLDRFQGDQLMANHEQLKEFSMNSQRFVLAWVRKNFMQS